MGGIGSGRKGRGGQKGVVEKYCAIDTRKWYRQGMLLEGRRFSLYWSVGHEARLQLDVRVEAGSVFVQSHLSSPHHERQTRSETIFLDSTPCNFGGERLWFLCPIDGCSRRVAVLYWGGAFACRECMNLCYQSQLESDDSRASRRVNKIRKALGWEPGFLNGTGWKPKHMHWKTFADLLRQHERGVSEALLAIIVRFKLKGFPLDLVDRE
jgi:hypothetical protein